MPNQGKQGKKEKQIIHDIVHGTKRTQNEHKTEQMIKRSVV